MITPAMLWLLKDALFFLSYISGRSAFPKPLPSREEQENIGKWLGEGDEHARNLLVEHNLRLVAHIINNSYYKQMELQKD